MAEERYNYNMATAIDNLLKETAGLQDVNSEWVITLKALANESRSMRAAAQEYAASQASASGSSTSESSSLGSSTSSSGKTDTEESSESDTSSMWTSDSASETSEFARFNTRRDEAYKRSVEHLVSRLRYWRMELEDAKYESVNFDAPLTVWTRKERNTMRAEIRTMSYDIRKEKILAKMVQLNTRRALVGLTEETRLGVEMLELLLQDIFLLRVMPFKDIVFPLTMENIYDWNRVSVSVKGTHTPAECQEFWFTKFHPEVNGKCWSKAENKALMALADAYNLHHWDEIAKQLNTRRTGFQCFVQYRRYLYKSQPVVVKVSRKKGKKAATKDEKKEDEKEDIKENMKENIKEDMKEDMKEDKEENNMKAKKEDKEDKKEDKEDKKEDKEDKKEDKEDRKEDKEDKEEKEDKKEDKEDKKEDREEDNKEANNKSKKEHKKVNKKVSKKQDKKKNKKKGKK